MRRSGILGVKHRAGRQIDHDRRPAPRSRRAARRPRPEAQMRLRNDNEKQALTLHCLRQPILIYSRRRWTARLHGTVLARSPASRARRLQRRISARPRRRAARPTRRRNWSNYNREWCGNWWSADRRSRPGRPARAATPSRCRAASAPLMRDDAEPPPLADRQPAAVALVDPRAARRDEPVLRWPDRSKPAGTLTATPQGTFGFQPALLR